jgi:hypothetical protein
MLHKCSCEANGRLRGPDERQGHVDQGIRRGPGNHRASQYQLDPVRISNQSQYYARHMRVVVQDDDSAGFIEEVRACVSGMIRLYRPAELFLIKTNTWFGPNWLRFKGKVLGSIGAWSGERARNVPIPPFVPHRILWERRYAAPDYKPVPIRSIIHVSVPADRARVRFVHEVAPNSSLVWYSGASSSNRRGAIMAYVLVDGFYWPRYLGWEQQKGWKIVKTVGVTADEISEIRETRGFTVPLESPH